MSDPSNPIDEVMRNVIPDLKGTPVGSSNVKKGAKSLPQKVYRSVNIDVTAEEKKAQQVVELLQKAEKQKKEEEESQKKQEEVKKMLRGMGFEV